MAPFWGSKGHLGSFLGRLGPHFGPQNGAQNDVKNVSVFGPSFGPKLDPKMTPKCGPKIALKRLLGNKLCSRRPKHASIASLGFRLLATWLSRGLFGGLLGSSRAFSGPSLGHLGSMWGRLWAMTGALGGFLGSARALFEAIIGCPRCSLQALRELERIWDDLGLGWGGWGGVSKQARILDDVYSRSSHTKGD